MTSTGKRIRPFGMLLASFALVLAACGDDDGDDGAAAEPDQTEAAAPETEESSASAEAPAEGEPIVVGFAQTGSESGYRPASYSRPSSARRRAWKSRQPSRFCRGWRRR